MINRAEVIEALRKIKSDCQKTRCDHCPLAMTGYYGSVLGCGLYDVMTELYGTAFEEPHMWHIEKLGRVDNE